MKKTIGWFVFVSPRVVLGLVLSLGLSQARAAAPQESDGPQHFQVGHSYKNDVSPALRDLAGSFPPSQWRGNPEEMREANLNPRYPVLDHVDGPDPVIQSNIFPLIAPNAIPPAVLNFDGIPFPGVSCNCFPPDTNGAVGLTQFVQSVNEGYQVFDKATGASVLGPLGIQSIWAGFGGLCQSSGAGDPIVLYDRIANRWLVSQFAGGTPTDECIAISTTSDATGTWNRYGFHLGPNFFDYPHLGVWPDGYYMANNVFNAAGTARLGPQAFAFDRAKMLQGLPATFISPGNLASSEAYFLPADFDGTYFPATNSGNPYVSSPGSSYKVRLFKANFASPDDSSFTQIGAPMAATFTTICPGTRACVPQLGVAATNNLDALGDRLMFRLAYRKFADGHEAVVGNYTVNANGIAAPRWFELRDITTTPVVFQESTYQPGDTTWRWLGSAAMDAQGNMALGFSASDATIHPQIRYAGRLVTDPVNTLAQGEAHLFDGTGSQSGAGNRWGDYSQLSIDPVDDCTFWFTSEYVGSQWRTRIGNFKFSQCVSTPHAAILSNSSSLTAESCQPPNNVIDPFEQVTVSFCVLNAGNAPTANLVGTLQDTGGVTGGSAQNFGVVAAGATGCQAFTFVPTGNCGDAVTATIHFMDGSTDLGDVTFTFNLGLQTTTAVTSEKFDTVTAPALPTGWTTTASGAEVAWVTTTTNAFSPANAAFAPDVSAVGETELVSPAIPVPAGDGFQLRFKNLYNMDNGFDGMVLEISTNGGPFSDIITAGGTFVSGGYNRTIDTGHGSAIGGRMAWSGLSGGTVATPTYITTRVNLPPGSGGQSIQLKWRIATDNGSTSTGQNGCKVDDISLAANFYTCCLSATPTPTPSPTPTPTPTPTPSPTPTPTPTPTPIPPSQAINLSTRLLVQGGDSNGIGGFIVQGNSPKTILIRGIGPSLTDFGVPNALANPALELHGSGSFITVNNNDWRDNQEQQIIDTGIPPTNDLESAILATLDPGAYTAIIKGQDGGTGVCLIEVYDLSVSPVSKLANISTRAFVSTGNDAVIAGFILGGSTGNDTVVIRGIGPSLADFGVPDVLSDPILVVRNAQGAQVAANNDWQDSPSQAQQLQALGLAPTNALESALIKSLAPGAYTAILSGVGNVTGNALVEVYDNPGGGPLPTPGPTPTPCADCTPTPTPVPGTPTPTPVPGTPTPTPPASTPTPTPGGTPGTCVEAFDSVAAPGLPAGWVASNPDPGDGVVFVTVTAPNDTAPNSAFIPDQDGISDKVLDSKPVNIQTANSVMTFRNNFNSEFSDGVFWDGGVLEVSTPSISGGDFLDITDSHVGGSITAGGYTGEISGDASNPLSGRMAWSGSSSGFITTTINMGPNLAGQTATLRFRFGSDEAVAAPGWWVDTISITDATCP